MVACYKTLPYDTIQIKFQHAVSGQILPSFQQRI